MDDFNENWMDEETFKTVIKHTNHSILLGNEFSCNYHENFNSQNILKKVKNNWYPSDFIKKLLDIRTEFDTYFE